jgi:GDP-L-fucose synthase
MKIFVAGHRGLVGSALVRKISKSSHQWVGAESSVLDLRNLEAVATFLASEKPDAIILAAAKVGGIMANKSFPVDFLMNNLEIQSSVFRAAHAAGIPRLVFLGSSCIYPKHSSQPIRESSLLTGPLEETNRPYALAKIAGLEMVSSYRTQFGHDWIAAMPTNVYGPGDNYDLNSSHVLPGLLRKFHDAKVRGDSRVTLWGSGSPLREFIHSDDLASAILHLLENYHSSDHINVGTGVEVSIRELADIIKEVTAYDGDIIWDANFPDGTPRKLLDVSKLTNLGWKYSIGLRDGIESTYAAYLESLKGESNV